VWQGIVFALYVEEEKVEQQVEVIVEEK